VSASLGEREITVSDGLVTNELLLETGRVFRLLLVSEEEGVG